MATSLYDMSIPSYLQVLGAASGFMRKGAEHCAEHGLDPGELVEASLREDMLPFRFQVISICHHSLGAIRGIQEGVFTPPPAMPDLDYAGENRQDGLSWPDAYGWLNQPLCDGLAEILLWSH
jgi:hypothetical protein